MYLSRLKLNMSRMAVLWVSNAYHVHQRLLMAFDGDPRLLFRIEELDGRVQILIQSSKPPNWDKAFENFPVLDAPTEHRKFEPTLVKEGIYRFRLLANPTVKKTVVKDDRSKKTRLGLITEQDQADWLQRKMSEAGACLIDYQIQPQGFQHSNKKPEKKEGHQTHYAVLYEGILQVEDGEKIKSSLTRGLGSAKGYGFGLLSLAKIGE